MMATVSPPAVLLCLSRSGREKRTFWFRSGAQQAARRRFGGGWHQRAHVYRCECGGYHLATKRQGAA
jgi:hypothetical protein